MKTQSPEYPQENFPWRTDWRQGDHDIKRLSKRSKPGDRVYFDPGPGLRISGVIKDHEDEHTAVIEVDSEDRVFIGNKTIMKVPVVR